MALCDIHHQTHLQGLVRDAGDSQAVVGGGRVEHSAVNIEGVEM